MAQTVRYGPGIFRQLPVELAKAGINRLFVVHGTSSFQSSGAAAILESAPGLTVSYFSDVPANPEIRTVLRCLDAYRSARPQAVLAVGGGSVIDTAKAVLAFASGATESDILANHFDPLPERPRFIVAPTTAGSGSEATHFAVLYKDGSKYSIANQGLKPDEVYLDAELTLSCPPALTLASGTDAICQAVESYWSRGGTDASRALALESLPVLLENLFTVFDEPGDLSARTAILRGANLAGQAIDVSKTTAGHALSYGLTSRYGLPHGLAVLAVMRPLVRLMDGKYRYFCARGSLDDAFTRFGASFPEAFAAFSEELWSRLDINQRSAVAHDCGRDAVAYLASGVNVERLSNHPVALTQGDLVNLYRSILTEIGSGSINEGSHR